MVNWVFDLFVFCMRTDCHRILFLLCEGLVYAASETCHFFERQVCMFERKKWHVFLRKGPLFGRKVLRFSAEKSHFFQRKVLRFGANNVTISRETCHLFEQKSVPFANDKYTLRFFQSGHAFQLN